MTENEAINELLDYVGDAFKTTISVEAVTLARKALEKVQQFEAIGTIEEFKALKEKNEPKKPIERTRFNLTVFDCPTCNAELYSGQRFCDECGQAILDNYE